MEGNGYIWSIVGSMSPFDNECLGEGILTLDKFLVKFIFLVFSFPLTFYYVFWIFSESAAVVSGNVFQKN